MAVYSPWGHIAFDTTERLAFLLSTTMYSLGIKHIKWRRQWHPTPVENPMDGGAWWAAVHGVATSWTGLSDFTFTFHFHALEKGMATHSSILSWRIPKDGGAWWAAIYGFAQSWTQLKRLSSSSTHIKGQGRKHAIFSRTPRFISVNIKVNKNY